LLYVDGMSPFKCLASSLVVLASLSCGSSSAKGDVSPPDLETQRVLELNGLTAFGGVRSEHGLLTVSVLDAAAVPEARERVAVLFANDVSPTIAVRPAHVMASEETKGLAVKAIGDFVLAYFDVRTGYVVIGLSQLSQLEDAQQRLLAHGVGLDLVIFRMAYPFAALESPG
jgi:hypothetical protein